MRARLSLQGGHRRWGKVVDAVRLTAEAAMVPFAALLSALSGIPDPRRSQGRRYPLAHLLLFSVLAVLAGATSCRGILSFIGVHQERLNATFGTRLRWAPAVNTLRNLFLALDPVDLETAFRRHARGLHEAVPRPGRPVIALDGKTLRRSFDHLDGQAAAQVLGAFASEGALILAHQEVVEGDEVAAAQALIEQVGLRGVLFTAHARRPGPPAPADPPLREPGLRPLPHPLPAGSRGGDRAAAARVRPRRDRAGRRLALPRAQERARDPPRLARARGGDRRAHGHPPARPLRRARGHRARRRRPAARRSGPAGPGDP